MSSQQPTTTTTKIPTATLESGGARPGVRTSEFWLTLLFHLSAATLAILGTIDAQWAVAASGVVQSVYAISRGYAKRQTTVNLPMIVLALGLMSCMLGGCATPTARNTVTVGGDTEGAGAPSNIATMDVDGRQVGSYQGGLPTLVKQDGEGAWITTPGPGGAVVMNMGQTSAYIWSPLDGAIQDLTISDQAGNVLLHVQGLSFNNSTPAGVNAQMYIAGVQATLGMTQAEATRRLEQMKAAGEITGSVLADLIGKLVPTLPTE